jgi:hypothetical protein
VFCLRFIGHDLTVVGHCCWLKTIETILLFFVCTQVVNVVEGGAMEQVLKRIEEREVNDIATFNLFGHWLRALNLRFHSGHKRRATLCLCDVNPFLVKPMEKSQEVIKESAMGA